MKGKSGQRQWYLPNKILDRYENSRSDWKGEKDGFRKIRIQQEDYDHFGRSELLSEADELERMGLIRVKWFGGRSDMEWVKVRLETMNQFYQLSGREPKADQFEKDRKLIMKYLSQTYPQCTRDNTPQTV